MKTLWLNLQSFGGRRFALRPVFELRAPPAFAFRLFALRLLAARLAFVFALRPVFVFAPVFALCVVFVLCSAFVFGRSLVFVLPALVSLVLRLSMSRLSRFELATALVFALPLWFAFSF